jgi:hypothetical protein
VRPDGTPNLSPKASVTPRDDDHLVFADISSPRTVLDPRANPAIEIDVVDPLLRESWRFKGRAEAVILPVHDRGVSEEEVRASWKRYWEALEAGRAPRPPDGDF